MQESRDELQSSNQELWIEAVGIGIVASRTAISIDDGLMFDEEWEGDDDEYEDDDYYDDDDDYDDDDY